jgi:hypothetical protein
MQGNVTSQRRWEAYDKLGTFAIYALTIVLTIQALGLEVRSVLAIGGIGGLAIGLAGREICENLLNGFLLMTTVSASVLFVLLLLWCGFGFFFQSMFLLFFWVSVLLRASTMFCSVRVPALQRE